MRELRDPHNGCQIWKVPLFEYTFLQQIPLIKLKLPFTELVLFSTTTVTPKVKVIGTLRCIPIMIAQHYSDLDPSS